jgi:hypothetical protein
MRRGAAGKKDRCAINAILERRHVRQDAVHEKIPDVNWFIADLHAASRVAA